MQSATMQRFAVLIILTSSIWAGPASIGGEVLDQDGKPISNAAVVLRPVDDKRAVSAARTDSVGRFSIANLAAGSYRLTTEKRGFRQGARSTRLVALDSVAIDVVLQLVPSATIAGRVYNLKGEPLRGASVQLTGIRTIDDQIVPISVGRTSANDLGEYRFFDLQPGKYYVSAFYRDATSVYGLHDFDEASTRPDGIFDDYAVTYYPGTTSSLHAEVIRVGPGEIADRKDLPMQVGTSVLVAGRLIGLPLGVGAQVQISPSETSILGTKQLYEIKPGQDHFSFKSIPQGEYILTSTIGTGIQRLSARSTIAVNGAPLFNLSIPVVPNPEWKGHVVIEGEEKIPEGIELLFRGRTMPGTPKAPVKADGSFRIGLPADLYQIRVTSRTPVAIKSVVVEKQQLSLNRVDLARSSEDVVVTLTTEIGSLAGRIAGGDNEARMVIIVPAVAGTLEARWILADAQGAFKVEGLLPGDYYIATFDDIVSEADLSREVLAQLRSRGQRVAISVRQATQVELQSTTSGL